MCNLHRYVNTPREERTCSVCVNEIEDEYHFLFECKKNKEKRILPKNNSNKRKFYHSE